MTDAQTGVEPFLKMVRCPACAGSSVYAPSNPFRPFCSERCKLADLGAWASEQFAVAAVPTADELANNP